MAKSGWWETFPSFHRRGWGWNYMSLCRIKGDRANFSTITVNWSQIKPIPSSYCFCKELIKHDIFWNRGSPAAQGDVKQPFPGLELFCLVSKMFLPQTCGVGKAGGLWRFVPAPGSAQKCAHHLATRPCSSQFSGVNGCGLPENTLEYFRFIFCRGRAKSFPHSAY